VRLAYHHLLEADGDRVDYVLPRSESLDVKVPWDVTVEIATKAPIATVYSPSHELTVTRQRPNRLSVRVRDAGAPGPFRLSYLLQRNGLTASLFAYPDPKIGGGYFLLVAGLPATPPQGATTVKREVTLAIDRSGSMAGEKMDQVRAAALQVIEGLADGEAFNIVDYSHAVDRFAPAPVIKGPETIRAARAYLAGLRTMGGTNIHDALVESLRQPTIEGTLPIVLFLTDGLPTIGQTSEQAIREAVEKGNPHHRRVFAFGVGSDVNVPLLDRVAEITRATSTYVMPSEDVELKVAQVFRRLEGPVLASSRLETLDAQGLVTTRAVRELIPAAVPDLFLGDQLVVLGQYVGEEPLRFRLTGDYHGKARQFDFGFKLEGATTRNAFVPRLWASRRIAFLVDQIRQAGAPTSGRPAVVGDSLFKDPRFRELAEEILRLSTEFGVMSEYTSFLATEGTDLSDWNALLFACNHELDTQAVKKRSGDEAVAQSRNYKDKKEQSRLNYRNVYYGTKLERVEITTVQQICDRSLFKRGDRWIEGNLVAQQATLHPDVVVEYGTPAFDALLDALIAEGRQGMVARKGEILIRRGSKTVLVRNDWK